MLDKSGFRLNVGIILSNQDGKVFWGRRIGVKNAWQFPQGGVNNYETLEETLYRELTEEVGLTAQDVKILGVTKRWLHYHLPHHMQRSRQKPRCIGQKQKWFLLSLLSEETHICLNHSDSPEFASWRWVDYWYPLKNVIYFKYNVYKKALKELAPLLPTYSRDRSC